MVQLLIAVHVLPADAKPLLQVQVLLFGPKNMQFWLQPPLFVLQLFIAVQFGPDDVYAVLQLQLLVPGPE